MPELETLYTHYLNMILEVKELQKEEAKIKKELYKIKKRIKELLDVEAKKQANLQHSKS